MDASPELIAKEKTDRKGLQVNQKLGNYLDHHPPRDKLVEKGSKVTTIF